MKRSLSIKRELTLRDRLSRLTYTQACRLLGGDGERLIRGGSRHEIDIEQHVYLRGDLFRLKLPEAVVTVTLSAEAPNRLQYNCTSCQTACEHVGAAFGLILEEKTALGLAAPPVERTPVESLSEEELVRRAIEERQERRSGRADAHPSGGWRSSVVGLPGDQHHVRQDLPRGPARLGARPVLSARARISASTRWARANTS